MSAAVNPSRLVILLNNVSIELPETISIALRYAATAASMDVAVELHAVSRSVAVFSRRANTPETLGPIRQAVELGVQIFVCPQAMAEEGLREEDLIDEVSGVRGAASLLVAGLQPGAQFMTF